MECMWGEQVIYVHSSKDFEIVWKEKNTWKEVTSALTANRYCISTDRVNANRTSSMKRSRSIWNWEET